MAIATLALASASCLQIAGFDDFSFGPGEPPAAPAPVFGALRDGRPQKMDVLLVVDESGSSGPALQQLSTSLRRLLEDLLDPPCVDSLGAETKVGPKARCPQGTVRASAVVPDVHVGVVTTSLGAYGVPDLCDAPAQNRGARLFAGTQPTWNDQGFFVLDLLGSHDPLAGDDPDALAASLEAVLGELRADGCGVEQQLEAAYHFLADPSPTQTGTSDDDGAVDGVLLEQRSAFLRDDSLLFVVLVSEEDDGSLVPNAGRVLYTPGVGLERPTAACAIDPDDPCCAPCFGGVCAGCDDPACADAVCQGGLVEDHSPLLIAWDTKRRYGFDPFRPIQRYVDAFSAPTLDVGSGPRVPNPLLAGRSPEDVVISFIAGVPWQRVARARADGTPDLVSGLDRAGNASGGLRRGEELAEVWPLLFGDPALDPHMITSPEFRSDPTTGQPLPGPGSGLVDPIHGHEYDTLDRGFQYACISRLSEPLPCETGCPCIEELPDVINPVCIDPTTGLYDPTIQFHGYGYPGSRYLEVARALGEQAIVGSICAAQLTDPEARDYGFSAAIVGGLSEKLAPRLAEPACGPRVPASSDAPPSCRILEARVAPVGTCDCPAPGRVALDREDPGVAAAVTSIREDPRFATEGWSCYCEIPRAPESGLEPCRTEPSDIVVDGFGYLVSGWCSIDDAPVRAALADACDPDEGAYRLVGDGRPLPGASLFVDCR